MTDSEEKKKIIRFNQFIFLSLLVVFFSVISYLSHRLFISALINISAAYVFFVAYYFNTRQKRTLARILSVVNVNLYLIIMCYVEGLRAGDYLLFFPYFLALTFVVSIRQFRELVIVYSLTIYSLIFAVIFSPQANDIELIKAPLYDFLFNTNLVIAFLLTVFFSYAILRVHMENELAILMEKRFGDTIYNTSLDGVIIVHTRTKVITSCNQKALAFFEVSDKSGLEGTSIDNWFEEEQVQHFKSITRKVSQHDGGWQGELSFSTINGKSFPAFVSVVPFTYKNLRYVKISILDISNLKMTEFELMRSKEKAESAVRAKTRFLSNMSHELRTPLNGIIGATNLLLQDDHLPEQQHYLDTLKYSSEHMMTIINDILDYSKIDAGKMELDNAPLNIFTFSRKVAAQFSGQIHEKGLLLHIDVDPWLDLELMTDSTRLNQVISNLLSNAIKFTEAGAITFAVRKIMATSSRASVQFIVRDTGIGIPKHKHKEIFESFTQADVDTTRKFGGTGLGLAITKQLIRKFNSQLHLDSEPGSGSTFHFTLELAINANRKMYINEDKSRELHLLTGTRILVAEDNPVNIAVLRRFLQKWDVTFVEAQNGREAIERYQETAFDLLLIDLEMPEMDGATALAHIREKDPYLPVIAFTAAVYENMQTDLLSKGFSDFIHKPFRPEDLHQKIDEYVNKKRRRA
jgi:PAS domain S-box-containing protein